MAQTRLDKAAAWKRWYKKNRKKVLRRSRIYRKHHRTEQSASWKRWYAKRIADPTYRLKKQKRNRRWYKKNRQSIQKRRRADRKHDPLKYALWERTRRTRNPQAHAAKKARYYMKHKKFVLAKSRAWREKNKKSHRAQQFKYRASHKKALLAWRVKKQYGLTLDAYLAILARPCEVCGGKAKHLDHCHATRLVRGGLCNNCNLGLGLFKDDPVRLRKAARYLAKKRS